MNILAFGTSNNKQSINRTLAAFAAQLVEGAKVDVLNIDDYEMPLFSDDREKAMGRPPEALAFYQKLVEADAFVVSFAEHNGSYTAAYKNLFDWTSRISKEVFQHKPAVFLATSPGPGGAASVLESAVNSASYFGADIIASISVPSFYENFDTEAKQLVNPEIRGTLLEAMLRLKSAVDSKARSELVVA